MLMTIKNKMLLAMDSMIETAENKGGVPKNILFEPLEAAEFLKEIRDNLILANKHIDIKQTDGTDTSVHFVVSPEMTKERLQSLIKQWYTRDILVYYKNIEVRVVKAKVLDVPKPQWPVNEPPEPPIPPPGRILYGHGGVGICDKCGSSLHSKWIFWNDGCLQPKCENYYDK